MVYWHWKSVRASSKSCKRSNVEGRNYVPMIGISFPLVTTSHLTTFALWKCADSTLQPWDRSWTTRNPPPPPCTHSTAVVLIGGHTTSYLSLLQKKPLVIDLGLRQYRQVKSSDLYLLDGLNDPRYPNVADVEGPKE